MLIFQSTRPSRASTSNTKITQKSQSISIHKALAGLDVMLGLSYPHIVISIHKALAGLDEHQDALYIAQTTISIHKALAGLDP